MRARVTNFSRGARGFHTRDRGTALLEPGASALLDLADHPAHRAWEASGEVRVEPDEPAPRGRDKASPREPGRSGRDR